MKLFTAAVILALGLTSLSAFAKTKPVVAGGSNQRMAVEGCMNKWLFNGVWRLRVLSVDPAASYNDGTQTTGIGVKVQIHNGTSKELEPDQTGLSDINGRGITLAYADDNTVEPANAGGLTENFLDKTMPPGGGATVTMYFPYDSGDKTSKPTKLIIPVDQKSEHNTAHVHYSVKDPSFRVKLTCNG